jgi:flagellar biogenesis protein FliO
MVVLRRITAFLAMIAIIGLLMVLVWQVEMHRQNRSTTGEPAIVELTARSG